MKNLVPGIKNMLVDIKAGIMLPKLFKDLLWIKVWKSLKYL